MMIIENAKFVKSSPDYRQCPDEQLPEYAFIGRSNVGKSSLINMITGRKKLAKISGTPGKTQLINHFQINEDWFLVDLPGYGYAKISKRISATWEQMINNYLINRSNLINTFLLIDSRHEPQKSDLEFINWFGENQLPFVLVFTKTDKLGKMKLQKNLEVYQRVLLEQWEELPASVVTSSQTGKGKLELLGMIDEMNQEFRN